MTSDIDPLIRFSIESVTAGASQGDLSTVIWQVILQIILIVVNAVFACAEIAVISINDSKLAKMSAEGDKRARRLAKLTAQPAKFLSTIQVAITLAGFLASAFAAENFAAYIESLIPGIPKSLCVVMITIILSYLTLIFGELVPKRVAMKKSESIALGISGLLYFVSKLFAPLVWLLTVSTTGVLRLMRIDPNQEEEHVTEEEIRMMVDVGSEKGTIDKNEKTIIQNVFEFDDLTADEIATHRTDIDILWIEDDESEWGKTIHDSRHSQYPVCGESVDDIVGVLNAKDYFRLYDKSRENVIKNAIRPAYFVPEGVKADVLFKNMQHERKRLAIVLDEYGGMSGIVTMNDLVERLVGDLDDEDDEVETEEEIKQLSENTWQIKGSALIEDVIKTIGISLPDSEFDTFGGFLFAVYGRVVDDGETFEIEYERLKVKATEIRDHRIEKSVVTLVSPEKNDD